MTNVNLNNDLYDEIVKLMDKYKIEVEYPSIKSFVDKAVKDKVRLEIKKLEEFE